MRPFVATLSTVLLVGCAAAGHASPDASPRASDGSAGPPPPPAWASPIDREGDRRVSADDLRLRRPPGVRIHRGDGTPASWEELVEAAGGVEVVLLGELHDDSVGHRARHALTLARIDAGDDLAISLEMFETDVQQVLNEYLLGLIGEEHFLAASRPWGNYDPDYRPYVEMAREHRVPLIAANPPRRYVNRVSRLGPDALADLPPESLRWLPPLPYAPPSSAYRAEWEALMQGAGGHGGHGALDPEASERMLFSQALWDAGMAWSIVRALEEGFAGRVVHVAGAFHVAGGTGIPERLEAYRPGTSTLLVVGHVVSGDGGFDPETHGSRGDFILLSPRNP